jgi:hypothetical protein
MSVLLPGGGRIAAYHDRYVGPRTAVAMEAFWAAQSRFLRRKRQTLLDTAMEASAAQWQAGEDFDDLDPRLQQALRETVPGMGGSAWTSMDEAARLGAINTSKGKYFEFLVVDQLNAGEQVGDVVLAEGQRAVLAESATQPGWDVQIVDANGELVRYLQMKATENGAYIRETLERYPDFQIVATSEVASQNPDDAMVLDSGISNAALEQQIGQAVDVMDATVMSRFVDYFCPLWPLMAIAAMEGYRVHVGRATLEGFKAQLAERGKRLLAIKLAGASAFALGAGLLAIPAGLAGGLWYDRFRNLHALDERYQRSTDRLLALAVHRHRQL